MARELLISGAAHLKMRELIKAQGGDPDVGSNALVPGKYKAEIPAYRGGKVHAIDNRQITIICRILGCPTDKKAGMYLVTKLDEQIDKGDILYTLYSSDAHRLREAVETMKNIPVYSIE